MMKQFVAALCAAGCLAIAAPAAAFVAKPVILPGIAVSGVELVASKSSYTRYYARKSAARASVTRTATRKAAYRTQTKRYQMRRDAQKYEAKRYAAKKERAKTRARVGRGIGY